MTGEPNTCSMEEDKIMEEDEIIDNAVILLEKAVGELEKHNNDETTDLSREIREFLLELGVDVWTEAMAQETTD